VIRKEEMGMFQKSWRKHRLHPTYHEKSANIWRKHPEIPSAYATFIQQCTFSTKNHAAIKKLYNMGSR